MPVTPDLPYICSRCGTRFATERTVLVDAPPPIANLCDPCYAEFTIWAQVVLAPKLPKRHHDRSYPPVGEGKNDHGSGRSGNTHDPH